MNSLNLKKLVEQSDCENNTDKIRELKHSCIIQENMLLLDSLKKEYSEIKKTNHNDFLNICIQNCSFLYNNYTEIFHKAVNDELNMTLMQNMLSVLNFNPSSLISIIFNCLNIFNAKYVIIMRMIPNGKSYVKPKSFQYF